MRFAHVIAMYALFLGTLLGAELKVVSLHPLVGDLLRQVGGDKVEVVDLIGEQGDPHTFEPRTDQIAKVGGAKVYFVSGMGLEGFLPKLRSILPIDVRIVEVGASLPALHGACESHDHDHDHAHEKDPHWWHSVDLFRRATSVVAEELSKEMPSERESFEANATAYRKQLDELEKWMKREIVKIPKERRKLASAHSAFQYFCDAYGFEAFAIQGLNREQMPGAKEITEMMKTLKKEKVVAIFPERESNPKILKSLTSDIGIKLGEELIADGRGVSSYEAMMRSNVTAMVSALSAK
jgi:zinc/manganese transport system substrate-binding protein